MMEKLKDMWWNHKKVVIIMSTVIILSIIIISVTLSGSGNVDYGEEKNDKKQPEHTKGIYATLVLWTLWFDPILKTLIGIACLKYILFHWN